MILAGRLVLFARGRSQWPLVRPGQVITVVPIACEHFRPGDLAVFRRRGTWHCHRILRVRQTGRGSYFFLKGDAIPHADGWIPAHRMYGVVTQIGDDRTDTPAFRAGSALLFWHSRLQHALFHGVFELPLGRFGARLRRRVSERPLFMRAFTVLTAPWTLLAATSR
jgi:hypothetical protein